MAADGMKPAEAKEIIEKYLKIKPHLIYYVYTCGHAHGPEKNITRKYRSSSMKTICPICDIGWLVTKYKECGTCGAVSCSLKTRPAPTGVCHKCPAKDREKVKKLTGKITSKRDEKPKEPLPTAIKRVKVPLYLPQKIKCGWRKYLCGETCIMEAGIDCKMFDGDIAKIQRGWVKAWIEDPGEKRAAS